MHPLDRKKHSGAKRNDAFCGQVMQSLGIKKYEDDRVDLGKPGMDI